MLPKVQQFKEYNFKNIKFPDSKETYLDTDHISIRPIIKTQIDNNCSKGYFQMKNSYGSHFESKNSSWIPAQNMKTINNQSGVGYNILNHLNQPSLKMGLMDKKIANRKKGLCEFEDITNPYNSNWDKNYSECKNRYPNIFKNFTGIFSHMYDAARKNGNLVIPFRKDNILTVSKSPKIK